jgi:hypothetical protein
LCYDELVPRKTSRPARRPKAPAGSTRGVVAQIDSRLADIDRELSGTAELLAEQRRLLQARRAITGDDHPAPPGRMIKRLTQQEVQAYLADHPGSRATQIARALGVPLMTVSGHLHRGKETRFVRREDGWYVREERADTR